MSVTGSNGLLETVRGFDGVEGVRNGHREEDRARTFDPRLESADRGLTRGTVDSAIRPDRGWGNMEGGLEMIDHVYISVTDIERSLAFYADALKPLGWSPFGTYEAASGPDGVPDLCGLGDESYVSGTGVGSSIWLRRRKADETGLYLGIVCDTNEAVDAAYLAAIKAGGIDEGEPADRTYFAPGYYAANVADFDGNRLEFVHKAWNPAAS